MINNTTDKFLRKIDELYREDIPEKVIHRAKLALLDYFAVSIAGAKAIEDKVKKYYESNNLENGKYKLFGTNYSLNIEESIFLNGLQAHALDYDDGTNAGIIHLGSPIFSLLLQLAQKYNISDADKFYKSVVIGYETSYTIANAIQPRHKQMGYHATGTCGILGSVVAASYLLDFSFEQMQNAFSIASLSSSGFLQVLDGQSELKPFNVAKTALLSYMAVQLSYAGFLTPIDALGEDRGFFKMMYGEKEVEIPSLLLHGTYAIEKAYVKPFAACRYTHPAIECAILLKEENQIDVRQINQILVETYSLAVKNHDHIEIPSVSSAKMSIPYGVAVGMIFGKAGLNEYNAKTIIDDDILDLTAKVKVKADEDISNAFPKLTTARMTIELKDGKIYTKTIDFPKGEPENPFREDEFLNRFLDMFSYANKTENDAKSIYNAVVNNHNILDIYQLV